MRRSKEIGWSQEESLIYDIIKKTSKLNSVIPGDQPKFDVPISRQIGWSNREILLYEWLRELSKVVAHKANCCC